MSIEIKNMHMSAEDFHLVVRRFITNCNYCIHMPITERKQKEILKFREKRLDHICEKHNKRCLHQGYHPSIIPCVECDGADFEEQK